MHMFFKFCQNRDVFWNIVLSGWWFYIYNEVSTIIIKKTGPVTQSIANTAKRVIIIVLASVVLGESLGMVKLIGCAIAIGGVVLYSEIDEIISHWFVDVSPEIKSLESGTQGLQQSLLLATAVAGNQDGFAEAQVTTLQKMKGLGMPVGLKRSASKRSCASQISTKDDLPSLRGDSPSLIGDSDTEAWASSSETDSSRV